MGPHKVWSVVSQTKNGGLVWTFVRDKENDNMAFLQYLFKNLDGNTTYKHVWASLVKPEASL